MVAFTTLFLGLVFGQQTVAVTVGDQVAAVEIVLDGESCGTVRQPPFQLQCDFGDDLSPHHLVAVAADAAGTELGRAEQWINLPRRPAETTLVLDRDADGAATVARLSWESLAGTPSSIRVSLDGRPIEVDDPGEILLPAHDPERLHLLQAEIDFGDSLSSVTELVFGGTYADHVTSEITAVPIVHQKGPPPAAADLAGWFVKRGESLEVTAVDRGPVDLVVVRDVGSRPELFRIWGTVSGRVGDLNRIHYIRSQGSPATPEGADREGRRRIEFLWPVTVRRESGGDLVDLFPHSQKFTGRNARLPLLLLGLPTPYSGGRQRLADALAVAGVTAASGNNRRAVVLVVGREAVDESDLTAEQVRGYLRRLSVPLEVWTVDDDGTAPTAWPEAANASSYTRIQRASRRLLRELERQSVVWLAGKHLPHQIELSELAAGIRIAGRQEPGG